MRRTIRGDAGRWTGCVAMAATLLLLPAWGLFPVVGRADGDEPSKADVPAPKPIKIDGSSTVYPIMAVAAEIFETADPNQHVTIGVSGTGGGFKKFLDEKSELRTDLSNASRPIKPSEVALAAKVGVEFMEIPIAIDGLAVMVHPSNRFCDYLSLAELKRIWEPGSTIQSWKDVRSGFPDLPLKLFGPGTDSGTFDYFTEVVVGKEDSSRSDYTASESDNMLVQGIAGEKGSLGYFGYAYYEANHNRLKLLAIDNGDGKPILPSPASIRAGQYHPLSRPLFVYVNKNSFERAEVAAFVDFFLDNHKQLVEHPTVQYVPLLAELYEISGWRVHKGITGTLMGEGVNLQNMLTVYRDDLQKHGGKIRTYRPELRRHTKDGAEGGQ